MRSLQVQVSCIDVGNVLAAYMELPLPSLFCSCRKVVGQGGIGRGACKYCYHSIHKALLCADDIAAYISWQFFFKQLAALNRILKRPHPLFISCSAISC